MQYFHDPIINVPSPKYIVLTTARDALKRVITARDLNIMNISNDNTIWSADSKQVSSLQDEKAIDTFRLLFNTYFPFLGNDSLRIITCYHTDMQRYTALNDVFTANIVIGASPKKHLLQVMTERHMQLNDYEAPSSKVLEPGEAFIMDADAYHSFRPVEMFDSSVPGLLHILQADVDYRWFVPPQHLSVRKHWVIGDILRVAKANAAGEDFHPPQPLPEPIPKNVDIYSRDLPASNSAGVY